MLKFVILLTIVGYAFGAVVHVDRIPALDGRIVGGADADITSFPWQVSLQKNGMHCCGGIIYSKTIIITAAHCAEDLEPNMISVRAGSTTWNSGGILVKVAASKLHEDYHLRYWDIGLLRLEKELTFTSTIRPIALASVEPRTGALAVATGWGQRYDGEPTRPTILQYVHLNMISSELCASNDYGYGEKIETNMICAAAPGKDTCLDDSGGALVSGGVVVGIVSYGIGCAEDYHPGIYTNIPKVKEWVEINAETL